MLNKLINWIKTLWVFLGFLTLPLFNNFQSFYINSTELKINNQAILISNVEDNSSPKNIYRFGPNSDTRYRIYMDSSGDKHLPELNQKVNDYIIGNGAKDTWHEHLIPGLSFSTQTYGLSKDEFLSKYKAVTFSYFYNYNFWNSKEGWTYEHGKHAPALIETTTFNLTSQNENKVLFYEWDSNHKNNESARLVLKQEWNGDWLNYNFYLGVSYHWQSGSTIKHASLAQFYNDYYSFTPVPLIEENKKDIKIERIKNLSTFNISSKPQDISLINFDKEIKNQAQKDELIQSPFKAATIFEQGYYGIKKIDNTIHILSIRLIWDDSINLDSTLLLNGFNNSVERKIKVWFENDYLNFSYENFTGIEINKKIDLPNDSVLDMKMEGNLRLPFIYSI